MSNPNSSLDLVPFGHNPHTGKPEWIQRHMYDRLKFDISKKPHVFELLSKSPVQGYGHAAASNGVHSHGWCLDFSVRHPKVWTVQDCNDVAAALNKWFATAFRAPGEAGPDPHLHVAYYGMENYNQIVAVHHQQGHSINDQIRKMVAAL